MNELEAQVRGPAGAVLVIRIPPKLVDETADLLLEVVESKLPQVQGAALVLDGRSVELINSLGITCLLQVQDLCRRRGAGMALAGLAGPMVRFLRQVRLDRRFTQFEDVERAVQAMQEPEVGG